MMQCKDIPDRAIIAFIESLDGRWGTWFDYGEEPPENSVVRAMPPGTPPKLVRAKMAGLIRRGLISGCACGCRGDFEITDKGRVQLLGLEGAE